MIYKYLSYIANNRRDNVELKVQLRKFQIKADTLEKDLDSGNEVRKYIYNTIVKRRYLQINF